MAGMQPINRDSAVTDPTLAANVNKALSRSQRAVDDRVQVYADEAFAAAATKDSVLRQAVQNLFNSELDRIGLSTANLAVDTDGTPYFSAGSRTHKLGQDTDGVPYFIPA